MTSKADDLNGEGTHDSARDADFDEVTDQSTVARPNLSSAIEQELVEYKDKYLRAVAELENFKKRAQKERSDLIRYQGERIIVDMLDVLDNLERALEAARANNSDGEKLKEGIELIHKQFAGALSKWDVRPEAGLGKIFDPNKFQAIGQVVSPDAAPGTIVGEMKKAYFYKDKLIRVGDVVVAQAATNADSGEPS